MDIECIVLKLKEHNLKLLKLRLDQGVHKVPLSTQVAVL